MIKKYRTKIVEIEAMLHEGGPMGWFKASDFIGETLFPYMMNPNSDSIHIQTLEGLMECKKGDYIVKGLKGEFYPVKPDIFKMKYEDLDPSVPETDPVLSLEELLELSEKAKK